MPPETGRAVRATPAAEPPRVLVLAESLPWPPAKGGDFRNWQHVHALSRAARVGVFGLCSNDGRRGTPPDLPLAFWEASRDPALTSPPPQGVRLAGRAWLLDPDGHPSDLLYSAGAAGELATLLARFRPDVALVEGLWMHRYLDVIRAAGCPAILDCHNIEALVFRELAGASLAEGLEGRVVREVLPARTEAIERVAVSGAAQLWVCSDEDARRLRDLYAPAAPIDVVPNSIRVQDYPDRSGGSGPRDALTLVFPGIFSYWPNARAAAFLADEVLPRLAAGCEAPCRLLLVGSMPTDEMAAAAARDPRVVVTGTVPDVRPFLAGATAMAVPLFHGSGTRFKLLEAFACGLPVVSTAKGAEGLAARHRRHLLLAETADAFAEGILAVWRDPALAQSLAAAARRLVAQRYSWEAVAPRIRGALERLEPIRADT